MAYARRPVTVTLQQGAVGSVTGYKDVSTVDERTLMSAVARQPVSTAIEEDQCSFQLYMSVVLCSRRIVPSVEVRLVRTSAAKPAEFEGSVGLSPHNHHPHSPVVHSCTLHLCTCTDRDHESD